jgi:sugar lactone lactonase YvrE
MASLAITHSFVSGVADGADTTLVRPSDWNNTHSITDQTFDISHLSPSVRLINPRQLATLRWYPANLVGHTPLTGYTGIQGCCFDGLNIWIGCNGGLNNVYRYNPYTGVVTTAKTGVTTQTLCFDGTNVWGAAGSTVFWINAGTPTTNGTITAGTSTVGCCFDGQYIWVSDAGSNNIYKINAATKTLVSGYSVGRTTYSCCFDGTYVWFGGYLNTGLVKFNPTTNTVVSTYTFPTFTGPVCYDGQYLWTAYYNSIGPGAVYKINPSDGSILSTLTPGSYFSAGICFDGKYIWVSSIAGSVVTQISTATGTIIGNYSAGTSPINICFDGSKIWVTNNGVGSLQIL